jgi:Tfp pilus assembly protein PilO
MRRELAIFLAIFTLLVIVYVVQVVGLQSEVSRLRSENEVLRNTYESRINQLQNDVNRLSSLNEELRRNYELQINQLQDEIKRLTALNEELRNAYESRINQLKIDYELQISQLQVEVSRLNNLNEVLKKNYESQIEVLNKEINRLNTLNEELKKNYESQIDRLKGEIEDLTNVNYELRKNLTYYMDLLSKLNSDYYTVLSSYESQINQLRYELTNLQYRLKYAVFPAELFTMSQEEVNNFLIRSINSVINISKELPKPSLEGFLMNVFEYVMNSTYYQYDSIAIRSENTTKSNYWKLANETLVDLGGDCEDLAVLVYSIIKPYINNTYLIGWSSNATGHVAVITYVNGSWYIIDPAGNWLNRYKLTIRLTLKDRLGREWVWWLSPTHIHPDIKKLGIQNNLFTYEWRKGDEIVTGVKGYSDPTQLLQDWLNYWREEAGDKPRLSVIDINTFYKDLTLNELTQKLTELTKT